VPNIVVFFFSCSFSDPATGIADQSEGFVGIERFCSRPSPVGLGIVSFAPFVPSRPKGISDGDP